MEKVLEYTKVLSEDSSFGLVRTNPKLTGNIKMVINEKDELWLNSIPVNLELAKDDFSKYPIDTTQSYSSNVYQFFKFGGTPNEIIFSLTEEVDTTKTSKDFKDQYDFSNYFSGIKYLVSNKYDEQFSYFAPLYIKDTLPEYFVVFKIKDPLNKKIDELKDEILSGQTKTQYLIDLFKKAVLVKTFDLRETTRVGKFIRDYRNNPNFPASPLTVNFEEGQYTTWNGIIINSGVIGSRGELLYSQYSSSTPLKFFEENITRGFERNGVIFPNILNLEFIFNDAESQLYDLDRYIGFYINPIDIADFEIDLARAYSESITWENTPSLKRKVYEYEDLVLTQSNPNGVIIPYKNLDLNLNEFNEKLTGPNTLYFNYIQDKDGKFYTPKFSETYLIDFSEKRFSTFSYSAPSVTVHLQGHGFQTDDLITIESDNVDYSGDYFITKIDENQFSYVPTAVPTLSSSTGTSSQETGFGKIRFGSKKIDLGRFFGPDNQIFLQDSGFASKLAGKSYAAIKLTKKFNHLDEIKLYHPNGTRTDQIGKYDFYTAVVDYPLALTPESYYSFNDFDGVSGGDVFYFNTTGLINEVTTALVGALNSTRNRTFTAFAYGEYVFIKCNVAGDFDTLHKIEFISPSLDYSTPIINDETGQDLVGSIINFKGGSKYEGNRLVIESEHLAKIEDQLDNLLVKVEGGWSKIKKTSKYIDFITLENSTTSALQNKAINDFEKNGVLILELEKEPTVRYKDYLIKKKFKPQFGLFSFFPIKDLSFDFLSSQYLNFPQIDLYQSYYVPSGVKLLNSGIQYKVIGGDIELVDYGFTPTQFIDGTQFSILEDGIAYISTFGDPIVIYYSDITAPGEPLTYAITDENKELEDFPGFSILKDPSLVKAANTSDIFKYRDKFKNGLTQTEYDFYKENEAIDFARRSKIIPYINKWSIKDGRDSRDNPYRLNTEIIFGRNNFSPDHTDRGQNPDKFTHEWFYIESSFNYLDDESTIKENNYYFDQPLDETKLLTEPDYFLNYFTYTPQIEIAGALTDIGPTQFRYSKVFRNRAGEYETFFKGFKILFKDFNDPTFLGQDGRPVSNPLTDRFQDYKFSCILKPIKEEFYDLTKPPLNYEVIEHKDFKFIVIVIKIYIGDDSAINSYWNLLSGQSSITTDPTDIANLFYLDPTTIGLSPNIVFETINGDYRIKFNQDDVSNLNYNLIYSLKNKKFNAVLNNFSNVKLSKKINYSQPILALTLEELKNINFLNYPSFFSNEVLKPSPQKMIASKNINNGAIYILDTITLTQPQNLNPVISAGSNTLTYSVSPGSSIGLSTPAQTSPFFTSYSSIPVSSTVLPLISKFFQFFVIGGGEQYFERLFENISFSNFKKYINEFNPVITYSSYSYVNSSLIKDSSSSFYLDILDQTKVNKNNQIIAISNEEKPSQFSFVRDLSYVYTVSGLSNQLELNRFNGEYEPISVDVLNCRSQFTFNKNKIEALRLANINFNTDIETLMTIQNFNHIKVSDTKILTLESDESFLPEYPSIGEIAIGSSDYFLFKGNWDWGFHKYWPNKTDFFDVSGTLRIEEDQNYLAKVMTLPSEIELEQFNIITVGQRINLDTFDTTSIEIAIKEGPSSIEGLINLNNVLTRYFIEGGISEKFNEFLVASSEFIGGLNTIEEYVKEYIKLNILELYEISQVEFYKKRNAQLYSKTLTSNPNFIQFNFLNDTQRFELGYLQIKTVEINKIDKLIIKFSVSKDIDAGFDISPKIKIKFI